MRKTRYTAAKRSMSSGSEVRIAPPPRNTAVATTIASTVALTPRIPLWSFNTAATLAISSVVAELLGLSRVDSHGHPAGHRGASQQGSPRGPQREFRRPSTPTGGSGVKASLLSTTSGRQVTYAGHPLYTYTGDSGPGKTSYVGVKAFGGTWYAINASGGTVK